MRLHPSVPIALALWVGLTSAIVPAAADPPGETPPKTAKKAAPKVKRVIQSIELAVAKKEPFRGAVTVKLVGQKGPMLSYYWGGKCKGTKLSNAQVALLYRAMKDQLAVEIPSYPIKHQDRIYMCMRSVRIINE
ncbi:MAG: hypothetical protein JRI68_05835 [Deltaproteobacteria bacterium]|nr:hypothetical protein [Deltaproteobacteria bacterium]